jgi:hypothetical protein
MPHFHLHQHKNGEVILDEEGASYPTLDDAVGDAAQSARELMAARLRAGAPLDHSEFHIADEAGKVVALVTFRDVLAGEPYPPAPPIGHEDW